MKVYLKSESKGLRVRKSGKISFDFEIGNKPVLVDKKVAEFLVKQSPKNFSIVKSGEKPIDHKSDFRKELMKIKGIGAKTADDITKIYPNKEALVETIDNQADLPFDDDVADKLKNKYGEKK